MPPTITDVARPLSLRRLKRIYAEFALSPDLATAMPMPDALVAHHTFVSCTWEASSQTFWRARKASASNPFDSVSDVLWPPHKCARSGRANLSGQQILYFCDRRETAASEALVRTCAAQFVGLVILPEMRIVLTLLGEFFSIYRMGYGRILKNEAARAIKDTINACRRDEAQRLLITDALLFEIFRKTKDYRISAYILKKIQEKLPISEGIIYHSVMQMGGINFAISPRALSALNESERGFPFGVKSDST